MHIPLDHHSGEPIYRQVAESIKYRIASGHLHSGDRLPSIRELSRSLEVNVRTVMRAYEELTRGGLVVMQQGRGVFVTSPQATLPQRQRRTHLVKLAKRFLSEAARLGATRAEVVEVIESIELAENHTVLKT
jgi:GntR family transcriptional regulator